MYVCSCRRTCAGALGSPTSSRRSSASSSRSTSLSSRGWPCWGAAVAACSTCDAATRVSRPCDACKQGRSGGQPERARARMQAGGRRTCVGGVSSSSSSASEARRPICRCGAAIRFAGSGASSSSKFHTQGVERFEIELLASGNPRASWPRGLSRSGGAVRMSARGRSRLVLGLVALWSDPQDFGQRGARV